MPRIISFVSPKGGCGATFVCAALQRTLSENSKKVLVLDMCFDKCTSDYALGVQNDYVYTLADVLGGDITFDDAVAGCGGVFLRADYDSEDFDFEKAGEIIRNCDYDYVLIDLNSSSPEIVQNVLNFSDMLVLVTDCTEVSVKLCDAFAQRYDFENTKVIINKIFPHYIQKEIHMNADEITDALCYPLLGLVPLDITAQGLLKNGMENIGDHGVFGKCFSNIAKRILGKRQPAYDFSEFCKNDKLYKYLTKGRN